MSYPEILQKIKDLGLEQWSWVVAIVVFLGSVFGLLWQRLFVKSNSQPALQVPNLGGVNQASSTFEVGQQIAGQGHTIVVQNNSTDTSIVQTLLDRLSERDIAFGAQNQALVNKDKKITELSVELQDLRRQAVQTVVDGTNGPRPNSLAIAAVAALKLGEVAQAQALLLAAEAKAASAAQPHRLLAAQLAKEQAALWVGRDVSQAYAAFERAYQHYPADLFVLWSLVDLARVLKTTDVASRWAETALRLTIKCAASDPQNNQWQYGISISYGKLGTLLAADGKRADALKYYQHGLEIRKRLSALDPQNIEWKHALSISYDDLGNLQAAEGQRGEALKSYQHSLEIARWLAAQEPKNTQWQRELSISYERLGDLQLAEGKRVEAVKAHQECLEIVTRAAAQEPTNTEWQRDLSLIYLKIGQLQFADGKPAEALKLYQDALEISRQLAALGKLCITRSSVCLT